VAALKIIGAIDAPAVTVGILAHLGLPACATAGPGAPVQYGNNGSAFEETI